MTVSRRYETLEHDVIVIGAGGAGLDVRDRQRGRPAVAWCQHDSS